MTFQHLNNEVTSNAHTLFEEESPMLQRFYVILSLILLIIFALHLTGWAQETTQAGRLITVDDDGVADFASLVEAVDAAQPGDVIRVAPGVYQGQLLIQTDDLTIVGAGAGQSVIESDDIAVIFAGVAQGRFAGFTVRYTGTDPHSAMLIFSASPVVENNEITGASLTGVDVRGAGARPLVQSNNIVNNAGSGVVIHRNAQAVLAGNVVMDNGQNGQSGVEIKGPASALLSGNLIEANGGSGVLAHSGAVVELANNLILRNRFHGISLIGQAAPANGSGEEGEVQNTFAVVHGNSILFNQQLGVRVRGKAVEAELKQNIVVGNVVGLLADNGETSTYERNFVAMNKFDFVGKGASSEEAQLNGNLLFHQDFMTFSNAVLRLQEVANRLTSQAASEADGVVVSMLLDKDESIRGFQQLGFIVADIYRMTGFVEEAKVWYLTTIQLDSTSELAATALEQLKALL